MPTSMGPLFWACGALKSRQAPPRLGAAEGPDRPKQAHPETKLFRERISRDETIPLLRYHTYEIFRSRNFCGPFSVSCVLVDDFARFVCSSAHLTPHTSTTTCPSLPAIAGLRGAVVVENQCRPGRATQWCVLQPAGFLPCTPCKPSRASQHYDPKKHTN